MSSPGIERNKVDEAAFSSITKKCKFKVEKKSFKKVFSRLKIFSRERIN
jgi:hypothetical protein